MRLRLTDDLALSPPRTSAARRPTVAFSLGAVFLATLSLTSWGAAATPTLPAPSTSLEQSSGSLDPEEIELLARAVSARAVRATVGLRIGRNLGSGVIVSEDGVVITAGHVVEAPGQVVEVTLSDGRVVSGKTLGVNRWIDSGMLKLDSNGPWPSLEMGSGQDLQAGDWVLALGHPGGVEANRPPVVRMGRVHTSEARVIRTDCTIVSGDSGGPLVDLNGRVVGIHTSLRPVLVANDHLPVDTFRRTWDELRAGKSWGGRPVGRAILGVWSQSSEGACLIQNIEEGLAADLAGLKVGDVITRLEGEPISGGFAELEQRISEHQVGEPVWLAVDRDTQQLEFEVKLSRYEKGQPVRIVRTPRDSLRRSKNETGLMRDFRNSVRRLSDSVASVVCNGRRVALASVLTSDGELLTKASELEGEITCWLDGHSYDAQLLGIDEEFDLALLKVDATGLEPIAFQEHELQLGQWVIVPGTTSVPEAVGVIGTPPRMIPVRSGFLGVSMQPHNKGVLIAMVVEDSAAERAGLKTSDVLTKVDGMGKLTRLSASRLLKSIRPNSEIEIEFLRQGQVMRTLATLGSHPEDESNPVELQNRQAGPISRVRSGFPMAFQHDTVLSPDECGGPLVNLAGEAIGVNLARGGRTVSYGMPSSLVAEVVAAIKQQAHSARPESSIR